MASTSGKMEASESAASALADLEAMMLSTDGLGGGVSVVKTAPALPTTTPSKVAVVGKQGPLPIVYAVRTKQYTTDVHKMVVQMRQELGQESVWVLIEDDGNNKRDVFPTDDTSQIVKLDEWSCKQLNPRHQRSPWSAETLLTALHQRLPADTAHVWLLGDEVRCVGSWATTFRQASLESQLAQDPGPRMFDDGTASGRSAKHADVLSTFVEGQPDAPGWYWWTNGVSCTSEDCMPQLDRRWKLFDPVVRLSRRMMAALADHASAGLWTAHGEFLIPTLCRQLGFVLGTVASVSIGDPFRFGGQVTSSSEWTAIASQSRLNVLIHPVAPTCQ